MKHANRYFSRTVAALAFCLLASCAWAGTATRGSCNMRSTTRSTFETGKFQVMNQTQRIPVVALTIDKSVKRYNEFDISNKVREKGWILSAYSMPPDAQEINSLRIVVRPHLNRDVTEILANDIEEACEYLEQHGGTATPPKLHDVHKTSPKC